MPLVACSPRAAAPVALTAVAWLALVPAVAIAQELRVPAAGIVSPAAGPAAPAPAPQLPSPHVTLGEAVRLTLQHDPEAAIAREDFVHARGRLRETSGAFDSMIFAKSTFTWTKTPLQPFLRARENRTRLQLELLTTAYGIVDRELRAALASLDPRPPRCPVGFDLSLRDQSIRIDRQDPLERSLMGLQRDLGDPVSAQIRAGLSGVGVANVCTPSNELRLPLDSALGFWRQANSTVGGTLGLNPLLANLPQVPHEQIEAQQEIAYTISTRAALGRLRLADTPLDELRRDFLVDAGWSKPLRNGWFVSSQIRVQSTQQTFVGKVLDPSFGGSAQPILFPSTFTTSLTVPLARGGGRATVTAPERAAALNVRAENARLRHTLTERTFGTVLAYVGLVASQERVRYLGESSTRQRELVSLTEQLVNAQELAQIDLNRARAHAASAEAANSQARRALVEAQVTLVRAMGMDVASADALPVAPEGFADIKAAPDAETMIKAALAARQDRRALSALRDAAGILATAARADLRARYDMTISGGLSNTYDNPLFRFMPDELHPIYSDFAVFPPPGLSPVRFATPQGFYRSLTGRWEPFVKVQISYELPFRKNRYIGRSLQAEANVRRSTIEGQDLDRLTRDSIMRVTGSLNSRAAAIERRRFAIERQRDVLQNSLAQLRAGEATVMDLIATDEDLTREQVLLVDDLLAYFSTLARLQFDTGELMRYDGEALASEALLFNATTYVIGGRP
ncbi:MAG: TolC family protein [Vicinamibacterales bacterium]